MVPLTRQEAAVASKFFSTFCSYVWEMVWGRESGLRLMCYNQLIFFVYSAGFEPVAPPCEGGTLPTELTARQRIFYANNMRKLRESAQETGQSNKFLASN